MSYAHPFLKKVIARVDFLSPILEIQKTISVDLSQSIAQILPIPENRTAKEQEVEIAQGPDGEAITTKNTESVEWYFFSNDRTQHVCLNMKYMYLNLDSYESFNTLYGILPNVISSLYKLHPDMQISRLGLRYINIIDLKEPNPTDWHAYIDDRLLSSFNFIEDRSNLSRIFNVIEFNLDSVNIRFQYGMHNPDYPARIVKKLFILDLDAYQNGLISLADIELKIDQFHQVLKGLFEKSITETLREVMNQ